MGAAGENGNGYFSAAHKAARSYHTRFSIVPVKENKIVDLPAGFENYKKKPSAETVDSYFRDRPNRGVGIVVGLFLLRVIDIEFLDYFEKWAELVEAEAPGLLARLPQVKTPGKTEEGGRHVYYCSPIKPTTQKLARITREEAARRTGDPGKVTAIEVKGSDGYVVAPESPPSCHPSGRPYQHVAGPAIEQTPQVTDAEAEILIRCARALDRPVTVAEAETEEQEHRSRRARIVPGGQRGERPGDIYNRQGSWEETLESAGWKKDRCRGDVQYWTRPGKESGVSASTGHCGNDASGDLLYCFSSNAGPLEEGRCYSKFAVFALLQHGGNYRAAALALKAAGYYSPKAYRNKTAAGTTLGTASEGPTDETGDTAEPSQEDMDAEPLATLLDQLEIDAEKAMDMALEIAPCLARLKLSDPARLAAVIAELEKAGVKARPLTRLERAVNQLAKTLKGEEKKAFKAEAVSRRLAAGQAAEGRLFRNYYEEPVETENGVTGVAKVGIAIEQCHKQLLEISPEWPKRCRDALFVQFPDKRGPQPHYLESPPALFAWIAAQLGKDDQEQNPIDWVGGSSFTSEQRFFDYLKMFTDPGYDSIETIPHWPLIPSAYYMLPPGIKSSGGKRLRELLAFFNPATLIDSDLILAMFLTPVWGGPPGARPAFLIETAESGQDGVKNRTGVGKSTLAQIMSLLFGGHVSSESDDDFGELKTRLLSAEGRSKRLLILDNIKSDHFSSGSLESLITERVISGHQMFHGEGQRSNLLTTLITCNNARLSKDLSQRVVTIQLNRPEHDPQWQLKVETHVEQYRNEIFGDMGELLQPSPRKLESCSRWALWEREILARASEECADAIKVVEERRRAVDDDTSEGDLVREYFVDCLLQSGHSPIRDTVFIPNRTAAIWLNEASGEKKAFNKATSVLLRLNIPELKQTACNGRRGFCWRGVEAPNWSPMAKLNGR